MRGAEVQLSFQMQAMEACRRVFLRHDYQDIFLNGEIATHELFAALKQSIDNVTPYQLLRLVIDSVAAVSEGVDDAIRAVQATRIQSASLAQVAEVNEASDRVERERLRIAEREEEQHRQEILRQKSLSELELEKQAKTAALEAKRIEEDLRLQLRKNEQSIELDYLRQKNTDKVERTGAIVDRIGRNAQIWIALNDPGLYAKMQMANAESSREVAIALQQLMQAHAHDKGVTETLRDVMNQLRIGLSDQRIRVSEDDDLPNDKSDE